MTSEEEIDELILKAALFTFAVLALGTVAINVRRGELGIAAAVGYIALLAAATVAAYLRGREHRRRLEYPGPND